MMWSVETDAGIREAEIISGRCGWFQAGRLGAEATVGHDTALAAVAALQEAGHTAWMSPAPGSDAGQAAEAALQAYAAARDGIVEAVHAGLEARIAKATIARLAGLSRPGLDKIIDRYRLDALVKGE